jgi:MinD superfamily P-loop ATPase
MANNVLFYSRKGGQGKTTHAVGYAHYSKSSLVTNDFGNSTVSIYKDLFSEEWQTITELKPDQQDVDVSEDRGNVFDFGGFMDSRVIAVAKFVDYCVVPIYYQSKADLSPSVQTIVELEKYNKNIVIVINNTEKKDAELLEESLQERFSYPIFTIPKSRFINRLPDEGKSVFQLSEEGGLNKHMLRNLLPRIEEFYSYLSK